MAREPPRSTRRTSTSSPVSTKFFPLAINRRLTRAQALVSDPNLDARCPRTSRMAARPTDSTTSSLGTPPVFCLCQLRSTNCDRDMHDSEAAHGHFGAAAHIPRQPEHRTSKAGAMSRCQAPRSKCRRRSSTHIRTPACATRPSSQGRCAVTHSAKRKHSHLSCSHTPFGSIGLPVPRSIRCGGVL